MAKARNILLNVLLAEGAQLKQRAPETALSAVGHPKRVTGIGAYRPSVVERLVARRREELRKFS